MKLLKLLPPVAELNPQELLRIRLHCLLHRRRKRVGGPAQQLEVVPDALAQQIFVQIRLLVPGC